MHKPHAPLSRSKLAPLLAPINAFLAAESAGGLLLMLATLIALGWANSPWGHTYHEFWHAKLGVSFGEFSHHMSLEHWVNDGLMVLFFLLVGLEIKRELLIGELASIRRAALPVFAAIGGMVVPALIYAAFNARGPGAPGWGIPMATDIAFAVGVLTLVGRALPASAKIFLLAIAIVDDLGAVLVIALFYTEHISWTAMALAAAFLLLLIVLNICKVHQPLPYLLVGIGLWLATLYSGVHATVAGVLLAFTIPASRQLEERPYVSYMRSMLDVFEKEADITPDKITEEQSHAIKSMEEVSQAVQTPLARVEHALLKPVAFLIVPIFALANAGVDLRSGISSAAKSPISIGILLGLVLGKPIGVLLASWLSIKTGLASLPHSATWRQLAGIGILCGIGFTMSLFVAGLAFETQPALLPVAKIGILSASLIAGIIGGAMVASTGAAAGASAEKSRTASS